MLTCFCKHGFLVPKQRVSNKMQVKVQALRYITQ